MSYLKYIVVEDRFEEMFSYLPDMRNPSSNSSETFKVIFGYGDGKQLNFFLKERSSFVNYPLIWLLYPYKENHFKKYVDLENVSLILAVESTSGISNKERINETFTKILSPLFNNVVELFTKSNIISVTEPYQAIKYANYGEINALRTKEESLSVDIWDAIKVTFNCRINNNCLRPINFKNG